VCPGPWLVLGDFNLIRNSEDKNTGIINRAMMGRFGHLINDLKLKDLPLAGRKYTWSNQQDSPTLIKLDRVLCSMDWEQLFSNCLLQSCATDGSYHCPLLLGLHDIQPGKARFNLNHFGLNLRASRRWGRRLRPLNQSFTLLLIPWQENSEQQYGTFRVGVRKQLGMLTHRLQ